MMTFVRSAAVVAAMSFAGLAAHASTVTIDFQGALGGNPAGSYTEDGYIFQPNAGTNDTKCFDGQCLKEFQQGDITTMKRLDGENFDLFGFYFVLVGKGTNQNITVTGTFADDSTKAFTFSLGDLLDNLLPDVSVVRFDGTAVSPDDKITKNDGFIVSFFNGVMNGVKKVQWTTNSLDQCDTTKKGNKCGENAQARLDNVIAGDVPPPPPIPLPAAGWLMLAGIAGLAAVRRRKT